MHSSNLFCNSSLNRVWRQRHFEWLSGTMAKADCVMCKIFQFCFWYQENKAHNQEWGNKDGWGLTELQTPTVLEVGTGFRKISVSACEGTYISVFKLDSNCFLNPLRVGNCVSLWTSYIALSIELFIPAHKNTINSYIVAEALQFEILKAHSMTVAYFRNFEAQTQCYYRWHSSNNIHMDRIVVLDKEQHLCSSPPRYL